MNPTIELGIVLLSESESDSESVSEVEFVICIVSNARADDSTSVINATVAITRELVALHIDRAMRKQCLMDDTRSRLLKWFLGEGERERATRVD